MASAIKRKKRDQDPSVLGNSGSPSKRRKTSRENENEIESTGSKGSRDDKKSKKVEKESAQSGKDHEGKGPRRKPKPNLKARLRARKALEQRGSGELESEKIKPKKNQNTSSGGAKETLDGESNSITAMANRMKKARRLKQKVAGKSEGPEKPAANELHPNPDQEQQTSSVLISSYHSILKSISQLSSPSSKSSDPSSLAALSQKKKELETELEVLGGLEHYQDLSKLGGDKHTHGGETSKWLVGILKEMKPWGEEWGALKKNEAKNLEVKGKGKLVHLLDVGAIAGTSYTSYSFINPTYIDINPRADHVQKCDLLDFKLSSQDDIEDGFDVVALSLVLNFEGDIRRRASLISHAHSLLHPSTSSNPSFLFIVLPLPCLSNSRYLNPSRFESILETLGFDKVTNHDSKKLTFWLFRRSDGKQSGNKKKWKKEEIRKGVDRNNFCIVVD